MGAATEGVGWHVVGPYLWLTWDRRAHSLQPCYCRVGAMGA